jgi:hypothetical protein
MIAPGEVYTIALTTGPAPDAAPGEAAAFAVTLAAVLLAFWFARMRARELHGPGARRAARAFAAAFFFAIAIALGQAAYHLAIGRTTPPLLEGTAATLMVGLALAPLLGFADLMLEPLHPARRRFWLAAAPAGSAVLITAMSIAVAWKLDTIATMTLMSALRTSLIAGGSGLVWWSLLPTHPAGLAQVFE